MRSLFLTDGIGPFFLGCPRRRINWSKIPFADFVRDGRVDTARFDAVARGFERVCRGASEMGFNAVTLDDVAHLADWDGYPDGTRRRIADFRALFRRLCGIAAAHGMAVYLTTDVFFRHPAIDARIGARLDARTDYLAGRIDSCLADFAQVGGVILRIGESDGAGADDEFRSEIAVRTPARLQAVLRGLLPVFDRRGRTLILRTWSVGAYALGDLMWNRRTFLRAFGNLDHPRLVLSLKYGESDFFRYLPLSKQFARTAHRKIIELQARREYEGHGEYPSFTGWEYEAYARGLEGREDIVGVSVWCQTGGWSGFRRLTFLDKSGFWTELNAFCALRTFRDGWTTEAAIEAFCRERLPGADPARMRRFLRLSDEVIRELLYVDEYAVRKVYFRRVRLPPLITVYWDTLFIHVYVRQFLRCFVTDGETQIRRGRFALEKLDEMAVLAGELGLPVADIRFQRDTFELLAAAREFYFRPRSRETERRLVRLARAYRDAHPVRYKVILGFAPLRLKRRRLKRLIGLFFRHRRGYRAVDRILTLRTPGLLFPLVRRLLPERLSDFGDAQAMGWRTLFR